MKKANNTLSGKMPLNESDVQRWQMMSQNLPLSYQARREVFAHVAPRYQSASRTQKHLLLDAFLDPAGYACTSALSAAQSPPREHRPHLPSSSPSLWRVGATGSVPGLENG